MHLLAFEERPTPLAGGQERSLFEVCRGLSAHLVEISLAYRAAGDFLPEYQEFCRTTVQVTTRVLRLGSAASFLSDLVRLVTARRRIGWDVLYANQYFDLPLVSAVGMLTGSPVVCHLRLAAPHYLSRQYRWGLNRCAMLVANSQYTASTYVEQGIEARRITLVHNGVDPEYYRPPTPPTSRSTSRILYLGRVVPGKGLETLIRAFTTVVRVRPEAQLNIVGPVHGEAVPNDYSTRLLAMAAEAPAGSVSLGRPVSDVRPLLWASELLVLPSECGESFGRVLIESMACGTPVVATRDGGIPEVLEPDFSESLVPRAHPTELARAILQHLDWRTRDPGLGMRCRASVAARFSLDRMLAGLLPIFAGVMDPQRRRLRARGIQE